MVRASDSIAAVAPAGYPGSGRIRATYKVLILRGLSSTEAANLVAYLNGLRVGDASWTLGEVHRILFLRHLYRSGRLAEADQLTDDRAA